MKYVEDNIQTSIADYLRFNHILFTITNGGVYVKSIGMRAKLKRMGNTAGSPDMICFLKEGKTLGIEVKRPKIFKKSEKTGKMIIEDAGGIQSPEQKDFEKKMLDLGHFYILADSIRVVDEWFKKNSLLL